MNDKKDIKKVLILAYDFPPYVSVGGLRPYNWYKYLNEYGIYPIVITRQWSNQYRNHLDYVAPGESKNTIIETTPNGMLIRTPYKPNPANKLMLKYGKSKFRFLRKSISAYYELTQWIWNIGPKSQLYFAAKEYLKNHNVDVIIATGDPFVLFKYASNLSKEFKTPWIADYRDPWSQNKSNSKNLFLKSWNSFIEKKFLRNCSHITTVSNFVKVQISKLLEEKIFFILPNGYDPDAVTKLNETTQSDKVFIISFAGTIYKWHPIKSFLSEISSFLLENHTVKLMINFYGFNIAFGLQEMILNQFQTIKDKINIFSRTPNDELLVELTKSNLLLLFNDYSILGTKIYDYIGIKRNILLCYAHDEDALKLKEKYYSIDEVEGMSHHLQEDLIKETISGYIVQDAKHLQNLLGELYQEFSMHGFIQCNTINAEKYSRKVQTEKLADIIKGISRNFNADTKISVYQQCTRCLMDTSDVDIRFDENGVCNHCTNYFDRIAHRVYQGATSDKELQHLIEKIKDAGKGKKYDCVIGVSGGIDSSYVAYKAKKRGLRALLVHLDNGWNSEISVKNIKNLADILGFDFQSYVLDWEEFKDIQLSFLRASIPEMETPTDIAIPSALHQVAAKYGVKYIISGGNFATEGILPKTWHYNAKDLKYLKYIQKKFGTKKIRKFPLFGWKNESYYKLFKGMRMVYLLNYVSYNKQEAMNILQNELGWRYYGGKHYESKYTGFVQSYIMPEKFNMDYRRATLSTQICTGEVTREQALEELTHKPYDPIKAQEEMEYVCKKLCITVEEFEEIMKLPAKTYRDYPNAEKNLEFVYDVYRKLFKKPNYKES